MSLIDWNDFWNNPERVHRRRMILLIGGGIALVVGLGVGGLFAFGIL